MRKYDSFLNVMELSFYLAKFRFKLRNADSYLGILWYLLEPLAFFLIILLLRGNLTISPIAHYPIYLLIGLVMLNFFIATTNQAAGLIVGSKSMIKSIRIPIEALNLANVMQFCFSHFFEFLLLVCFMVYFGSLTIWILAYPLIFIVYVLFTAGASFIIATVGVFVEDTRNVWLVLSRLIWLGTPVFYSLHPDTLLYRLNLINPLFHFVNIAREMLIDHHLPSSLYLLAITLFSVAIFLIGLKVFMKYKKMFGEYM